MDSDLIQLVNKLQDTFANLGERAGGELDMPQLAVVGSQSSGKSSVLETIVGRDFLPRGQGIVTRCPLVLQLINNPSSSSSSGPSSPQYEEWGQFLHVDKRFTEFSEIRKEIEAETYRLAGQNKGISKHPIHLRIYSPNVLDLTLVDLPGLTKIPVGDQPSDIERQIRNLVLEYISKPNCVILSVSPANVDLANSESLKLARSVDPQGRRTIGVLTKLDLMDAGTNGLDVLTGRVYPLKLGFIGVVNRSQQDINSERSMADAMVAETDFFANHPAYRNIAHKQGTKYLSKTLNQVLMNHIREKLPDMKARLNTLMGQTQQELNSFGDSAAFDSQGQGPLILRLMTQFARDFISSIDGTPVNISTKELSGGARIYYIFNDVFGHALNSIDSTGNLDVQDIRTAIRNSTGPRPSLYVPEVAFDLLVKPQIKLLEAPSLRCVEMVYEELVKICHNCTSQELQRFPKLHAQLIEVISELLRERLGPTSAYTQSLIEIQAAYINTNHPSFVAGSQVAASVAQQRRTNLSQSALPQLRPSSTAPSPNETSSEGEEDDVTASRPGPNGVHRDARSVSSPLHDRGGRPLSRHQQQQQNQRPNSPSQYSARDSVMKYFFGQAGQPAGPHASSSSGVTHGSGHHHHHVTHTHSTAKAFTEVAVTTSVASDNSPLPRTTLDGSTVAFEMKSLEKHIEAVNAGPLTLSPREEMETTLVRSFIASYFSIVRQMIQDLVPKAIMHFMVNHTAEHVQSRLVSALYKPELFGDLLHEDETIINERARVKALLDAYREAFKTLSEISLKS
ncbi:Dynamin central region-domain-containing protein [Hysterangium stoloniferum]|nr:Dynamin central region-domain-containing protein [Hysterangium stoloniferum]